MLSIEFTHSGNCDKKRLDDLYRLITGTTSCVASSIQKQKKPEASYFRFLLFLRKAFLELIGEVQRRPGEQRENDQQQHAWEVQRREREQPFEEHRAERKGDADRRDQQLSQEREGLA